jgi:hypothetical protein
MFVYRLNRGECVKESDKSGGKPEELVVRWLGDRTLFLDADAFADP